MNTEKRSFLHGFVIRGRNFEMITRDDLTKDEAWPHLQWVCIAAHAPPVILRKGVGNDSEAQYHWGMWEGPAQPSIRDLLMRGPLATKIKKAILLRDVLIRLSDDVLIDDEPEHQKAERLTAERLHKLLPEVNLLPGPP